MGKLITSQDVQDIYKISRSTVDRWRKEGMPCSKVGRGIRFDEDEVRKWIEKNKQD